MYTIHDGAVTALVQNLRMGFGVNSHSPSQLDAARLDSKTADTRSTVIRDDLRIST